MEIDNDGVLPALPELASVIGRDVESQLEASGVRAIMEGGRSEVTEKGGCWGGWFREGMQPKANAGEESPDAGLENEKTI